MKYDLLQWHIAALEARATLLVVAERLAMNNYAGEEDPFIEDCENALNTISALPINEDAVRAHEKATNKYQVIVTRNITESVVVDVYADSEDAAKDAALWNIPTEAEWEIDDGSWNSDDPYVTGITTEENDNVQQQTNT